MVRNVWLAIVASAAIALLSACGVSKPTPTGVIGTTSPTPSAVAASTATGGVILPGCDSLAWRAAPVAVSHNPSVPPVPVITGIRPGKHPECKYDRMVLDISGAMPAYEIRYVSQVTADPSGKSVTVPGGGSSFLLITLQPVQAHTDAGASMITTNSVALGYPMLKGYAVTGDFEGTVSIALGLAKTVQVRAGELSGRLYVDVAY